MPDTLVARLYKDMALPLIGAPMFTVSGPELVIAQCANGIIGSMPSLNARPASQLPVWLEQIQQGLEALREHHPARRIAPYAVNLIVHPSNTRAEDDLAVCAAHRVPIMITSLRAPGAVVDTIHGWGGKVFHDVTTVRHAEKALEAGVDGLVLVCNGAGGHAGTLSPFALLGEVRRFFNGPIALSGAITRGSDIAAARAMGADFAYMGTRFIATKEASAAEAYKQMVADSAAKDILYTPYFSGIPGNYLKPSIEAAGLDPESLATKRKPDTAPGISDRKVWKDIWSAGQGAGNVDDVAPVATIVQRLVQEYNAACHGLTRDPFLTAY